VILEHNKVVIFEFEGNYAADISGEERPAPLVARETEPGSSNKIYYIIVDSTDEVVFGQAEQTGCRNAEVPPEVVAFAAERSNGVVMGTPVSSRRAPSTGVALGGSE
jgi:hypothetical protein